MGLPGAAREVPHVDARAGGEEGGGVEVVHAQGEEGGGKAGEDDAVGLGPLGVVRGSR